MGLVQGSGFAGSLARGRRTAGAAACLALASLLATCKVDKLTNTPPPVAKLAVAPGQIRDSAAQGSTAIVADSVGVSNAGQGTLSWGHAFALGGPWLTATADGGVAPGQLRLGFNPASLAPGLYRDTVVITAENADNSPARIPIEFAVHPCALTAIVPDVAIHDSVTTRDCAAPHHAPSYARAYTFSARANDSISVVMAGSGLASFVALDTSLAAASPPFAPGNACGTGCIYYRRLPTSGTYEIEAGAGPGQTGSFTLSVTHPRAPNAPGSLAQLRSDSTTAVAPGASIDQTSIVLRAVLTDPDAWDTLALEVEVEPAATPFTGTTSATSGRVASGVRAYVALAGLANNTAFHWQARTRDQTGRVSAWAPFGTGGSGAADFATAVPTPPNPPTALAQLQGDGVTPIPVGGTARTRSVVFRAAVSDPDPGDQLRLDVEVEPLGTAFTGVPSGSGATVANGGTASATIAGLSDNVSYHWQARVVDQTNLTGPWVPLGGAPDFKVAVTASQLAFTVPPS
ncbi:MAG TPA: hypothetical protein VM736_12470, partial [Gemmatimonadales bacterium]|nr:hypothetical protein [Gemmatimonadales bacterium]